MGYLLDTNIVIEITNMNDGVTAKFIANAGVSYLSAFSLVEFERSIASDPTLAQARRERFTHFLKTVSVLPVDEAVASAYGRIISKIGWVRDQERDRRLMIAAHAISVDCTLVTANVADFHDIPGLKIENWASA